MSKVGLWKIGNDSPEKLLGSGLDLEKTLENWIEADPSLVRNNLTIIGRQIKVKGGFIDLIAIDPQGTWYLIELKSGVLRREVISQVLDYASSIEQMSILQIEEQLDKYLRVSKQSLRKIFKEKRLEIPESGEDIDLHMFVVGTKREPGLERMISYLAGKFKIPISAITFDIFKIGKIEKILVREIIESEQVIFYREVKPKVTHEEVFNFANRYETGPLFSGIASESKAFSVFQRPYKKSIMYTPIQNKTRMLYTVWAEPTKKNELRAVLDPSAFAEFFPIDEERAQEILGTSGWRYLDEKGVKSFLNSLEEVFSEIKST